MGLTQVNFSLKLYPMVVTPLLIRRIIDAMEQQGVRRQDIAAAVNLGPSWVTKFLRGDLQMLRDEHRRSLENLLKIDLETEESQLSARRFSADALQMADLMERSSHAAELGRVILRIFHEPESSVPSLALPAFTFGERFTLGTKIRDLIELGDMELDARTLGELITQEFSDLLDSIKISPPSVKSTRKPRWIEHRGGVSAGSTVKVLQRRYWPIDPTEQYEADFFVLRVFGTAMRPVIDSKTDILMKPYRQGDSLFEGAIYLITSPQGKRLAQHYVKKTGEGEIDMFRSIHKHWESAHQDKTEKPIILVQTDERIEELNQIEAIFMSVIG